MNGFGAFFCWKCNSWHMHLKVRPCLAFSFHSQAVKKKLIFDKVPDSLKNEQNNLHIINYLFRALYISTDKTEFPTHLLSKFTTLILFSTNQSFFRIPTCLSSWVSLYNYFFSSNQVVVIDVNFELREHPQMTSELFWHSLA